MDLCDIEQIKALLARHGFRFSKSMGQNFLIDPQIPRDIAAASGAGPGTGVLEVGPGIGPLTAELSRLADKVVAVELDRALLPVLAETLAGRDNVEIVPGDILKTDIPALVREKFTGLAPVACANLPYNITTPAVTALLEARCFSRITVMVQREAAKRLTARPGEADYGLASLLCRYYADMEALFDVPPSCFLPAPRVTSTVLHLTPRPRPMAAEDEAFFLRVVRAAFAQRRKTLVNSLAASLAGPWTKEELLSCVLACGLPADVRGEKLGPDQFAALAEALKQSER